MLPWLAFFLRRAFFLRARLDMRGFSFRRSSGGVADEQGRELVETLHRAVLGGGGRRVDALGAVVVGAVDDLDRRVAESYDVGCAVGGRGALVCVQRQQSGVADARVHGDRGDPRVRGEDRQRQLGLGVGGEPGVAAGPVGSLHWMFPVRCSDDDTLTTRPPGSLVSAGSSRQVSR